MKPSRLRFVMISGVLALVLLGIAAWAYGLGAGDWHYKLADLKEDPLYLRGMPELSIIVGIVLSLLVGAVALATRAVRRRAGPSPEQPGGGVRWHWWWLLIAGWGGYFVGSAVVIAGGGPVDYRGTMHLEFGAPLGSVADVPATCRSVVGKPDLIARVVPGVDGLFQVDLRNVATGKVAGLTATLPVFVSLTDDGVPGNDFEPPNVPDRTAPYIQMTFEDGSTQADPPISFLRAYDYRVLRLEERGFTGEADLLGVRFADPFGGASLRWMNLEIPRDPWHAAMDLTVSWSCDRSGGSTVAPSPVPSPPLPSPTQSVAPAASASAAPASTVPRAVRARIRILTSVAWAVVRISGARFLQASRVDVQGETEAADFDGETFGLSQPGAAAEAGTTVSMTWDMIVEGVTSDSALTVEIMPGAVGTTTVILYNAQGDQPVAVRALNWSGYTGKALREIARWPASVLLEPAP
jgi:hypothetical protein